MTYIFAYDFNEFFVKKIETIRNDLKANPMPCPPHILNARSTFSGEPLSEFRPVTEDEVRKVIGNSPTTTAYSDPLPTRIMKQCLGTFLTLVTFLVNLSLSTGEFCSELKTAYVTPLLKKFDLIPSILKNY